jgi:hypothetical protein
MFYVFVVKNYNLLIQQNYIIKYRTGIYEPALLASVTNLPQLLAASIYRIQIVALICTQDDEDEVINRI